MASGVSRVIATAKLVLGRLRINAILAGLAAGLAVAGGAQAQDSSAPTSDPLPSVRILKGTLVSPTTAATYYGSATTSTDGLCRDYGPSAGTPVAAVCPSGGRPRAPEIKELARALKNDPNLIYEYLRNSIDTEFLFGAHKGPLGVIIDRSGTPFDQAELMVELLRESGFSARYKFGTITLTGAQFQDWTGLSNAQAACDFLATGGIPATVTGSTGSCTGTVSSVTLSHVWVEADVSGGTYIFDPSYKVFQHKTGIDVKAAMSITTGEPLSTASTGMTTGTDSSVPYAQGLARSALEAKLQTYSANLLTRLKQTDMQGADMTDVVGGHVLTPATRPSGGWKQTSFAYTATVASTWTGGVPDQYRAKLILFSDIATSSSTRATLVSATFFVDEIYGRRLQLSAHQSSAVNLTTTSYTWAPSLSLDGVILQTGYAINMPDHLDIPLTMTADHPFAASGDGGTGTYGDATVLKHVDFLYPATLVHAWGRTSPNLLAKWEREQAGDHTYPATLARAPTDQGPSDAEVVGVSGDMTRSRLAATWLAQFTRSTELHAELANARPVFLHTLGAVSANEAPVAPLPDWTGYEPGVSPEGFIPMDETAVVDLETSFGLVSRTSDANNRRAAVHAIAATAAALEGSVVAQLTDNPDVASTATRMAWGNNPTSESPSTTTRKAYRFTSTTAASNAYSLAVFDNGTTAPAAVSPVPALDVGLVTFMRTRLSNEVQAYAGQGFEVVASAESFLGPGHRIGSEYQIITIGGGGPPLTYYARLDSRQRGGAAIATKYDESGDPVQIAHVLTRVGTTMKGGGASAVTQMTRFNPGEAAQSLKDRFVDRSNVEGVDLASGQASFHSPVLASKGQGEFPYRLDRTEEYGDALRTSFAADSGLPTGVNGEVLSGSSAGLVSNWTSGVSFSNSGFEPMGQSRVEASASTLASFVAMQDLWRASPSVQREVTGALIANWWNDRLQFNVATVTSGASAQQFLRLADDTFISAKGGAQTLTVTGTRSAVRPNFIIHLPGGQTESILRVWNYDNVTASLTGENGDVRSFPYFKFTYGPTTESGTHGWRLGTWHFPQGVDLTLTYGDDYYVPTQVASNAGVTLSIPRPPVGVGCTPLDAVDVAGVKTRLVFRQPVEGDLTHRPDQACRPYQIFTPTDFDGSGAPTSPSVQYAYDSIGRINGASDAIAIRTPAARAAHQFFLAEGYRGERIDPVGGQYAVETMPAGGTSIAITLRPSSTVRTVPAASLSRNIDELGRIVTTYRDGRGRVLERLYPEGDLDLFAYDGLDHTLQLTKRAKPGAKTLNSGTPTDSSTAEPDITVSATYETTWNKPATVTDARGYTTNLTYVASGTNGASQLSTLVRPSAAGTTGAGPSYSFTYNSLGQPLDATDPTGVITRNAYDATSHFLTSVTFDAGTGKLNSTTSFTADSLGNVTAVTDPRGNVSNIVYATGTGSVLFPDRRKLYEIGPDPDGSGPLKRPAVKHTYDAAGRETQVDKGTTAADGTGFVSLQTASVTYDAVGNKIRVDSPAGVSQLSYDGMNRVLCSAVRMNAAVYSSLPSDACTASTIDTAQGRDRISKNTWDYAGQLTKVTQAFGAPALDDGTPVQRDYAAYVYGADGEQLSVQDANWNRTDTIYDGFNRVRYVRFPVTARPTSATAGVASNASDFEAYEYDASGNRVALWKRDGSKIGFTYDALNRQTVKDIPGGTAADVYTAYDDAGRATSIRFASTSGSGVVFGYDGAGRLTSETTFGKTMAFTLDIAGNRTRTTWPDTGFWADYVYDPAGRVTEVCEKTSDNATCHGSTSLTSSGGILARYSYDDLGRRVSITRGNAAVTAYQFDTADRLTQLNQTPVNHTSDQIWTYGYNPSSQVTSRTAANQMYVWTNRTPGTTTKTWDGLNRDATLAAVSGGYDARGNLTKDETRTFTYDVENRLLTVTPNAGGAASLTLTYDPMGRLSTATNGSSVATTFLYNNDRLSAEYNGSGTVLKRYVHGPATDEPLVWYEGSGTSDRRWLHGDAQGSVIAWSDGSGNITAANGQVYAYGPYGEPQNPAWGGSRFAYTGQIQLPEAKLYYYKARVYDPATGRFLQTDPIGYEADLDLYAYVRGDPTDATDPSGLKPMCPGECGDNDAPIPPPRQNGGGTRQNAPPRTSWWNQKQTIYGINSPMCLKAGSGCDAKTTATNGSAVSQVTGLGAVVAGGIFLPAAVIGAETGAPAIAAEAGEATAPASRAAASSARATQTSKSFDPWTQTKAETRVPTADTGAPPPPRPGGSPTPNPSSSQRPVNGIVQVVILLAKIFGG